MFIEALMMGMTYDMFWHDRPELFFLYLKAFEKKTENEFDKIDYTCWLQGLYIDHALSINNPLSKKKGKYLEKPLSRKDEDTVTSNLTDDEREEVELKMAELQFSQFERYVNAYNEQYFNEV